MEKQTGQEEKIRLKQKVVDCIIAVRVIFCKAI